MYLSRLRRNIGIQFLLGSESQVGGGNSYPPWRSPACRTLVAIPGSQSLPTADVQLPAHVHHRHRHRHREWNGRNCWRFRMVLGRAVGDQLGARQQSTRMRETTRLSSIVKTCTESAQPPKTLPDWRLREHCRRLSTPVASWQLLT